MLHVNKNEKGNEKYGLGFSPICGWKRVGVSITKFFTCKQCELHNDLAIIYVALLGVNKSVFPIHFAFRPYNCRTNLLP